MNYYVIGEDKSLEEAYTASEIDAKNAEMNTIMANNSAAIQTLQQNTTGVKPITSGTAAPSGGNSGDIYIQY